MDRWRGILKVPLHANGRPFYNVAASLCLSPTSRSLCVPSANAIFFSGDRVSGTGNPVIERLSDLQNIAEILVSKLGGGLVNAWVIEASVFNGPFAVYKDFIPSVNQWGEPKSYDPTGLPASRSIVALLSNFLQQVINIIPETRRKEASPVSSVLESQPNHETLKTLVFGFSKGGTVLNQLITELGFSAPQQQHQHYNDPPIIPGSGQALLSSVSEAHYVDVGLNSHGAYITDEDTVERVSRGIRFMIHGTPRQWCDPNRPWIRAEKDRMLDLLHARSGKLKVFERMYFAGEALNLQMHFEIIEKMDLCSIAKD